MRQVRDMSASRVRKGCVRVRQGCVTGASRGFGSKQECNMWCVLFVRDRIVFHPHLCTMRHAPFRPPPLTAAALPLESNSFASHHCAQWSKSRPLLAAHRTCSFVHDSGRILFSTPVRCQESLIFFGTNAGVKSTLQTIHVNPYQLFVADNAFPPPACFIKRYTTFRLFTVGFQICIVSWWCVDHCILQHTVQE